MVELIAEELGPTQRSVGLSDGGNAVELFISGSGRWVMLVTGPDSLSCLVEVGPAWIGGLPKPPGDPA